MIALFLYFSVSSQANSLLVLSINKETVGLFVAVGSDNTARETRVGGKKD